MMTLEKYRGWTLSASLFAGAVALVAGAYIGYQLGVHAYDDTLLDELLADMYYMDNPVACPPCDKGITYEWFYVGPQHFPAGQESAVVELKHEKVKPQKSVSNGND